MIDTHCHLHLPAFDEDRTAVLARMREKGMHTITVGTNGQSSRDAIALAEREPDIFATVGFHPSHLVGGEDEYEKQDAEPYSLDRLRAIAASSPRVVAIGEAGIDETYIRDDDPQRADHEKEQRSVFRDHIRVASEMDLPLIIHTRGAFKEIGRILSDETVSGHRCRVVVHCFTGDWGDASMLLDLGAMLSFTGIITFKPRATDNPEKSIARVIKNIPKDRIMIETDAPWLSPEPYRGSRNEPVYVEEVAKKIAIIKGESFEDVARWTTENAISFFRLGAG